MDLAMRYDSIIMAATLIPMAIGAVALSQPRRATFGDDVAFLKRYAEVIVLAREHESARVAVTPSWQGRVMTSAVDGDAGASFGWINRGLIASRTLQAHMNPFGGEDRFWMGPEGGQFSVFFARGAKFDLAHWFTPAPFDTEPFRVTSQSGDRATFSSNFRLTNYSGTAFAVSVVREIRLLPAAEAWKRLGLQASQGVRLVAYESDNTITNVGRNPWKKASGLLSIWILGMFNPSLSTNMVVPVRSGPESQLGPKVTSDYFGPVPPDRLAAGEAVIFFRGDGRFRSKIGISPRRSIGVLGSYDSENRVLTIVQFTQPAEATDYVNSLWRLQEHPYAGDVANAYNDGPPAPGAAPLGLFFELESSSPAAALPPGGSLSHVHRTIHLVGDESALDAVARATLRVSLSDITRAFDHR
jgi:hypothetical protein